MKNFFHKKAVLIGGGILVGVILLFILFSGGDKPTYNTIVAMRGNLIQEINATGRVEAVQNVDLAFEKSGRVSKTNVDVGDKVVIGQVLVSLESGELYAELSQARAAVERAVATLQKNEAALANQQAKLTELQAGTRPEEISLYVSKVLDASATLRAAEDKIIVVMQDALTRSEDAIHTQADRLFDNAKTHNPDLKFGTTDSSLRADINTSRSKLDLQLAMWKIELDALNASDDLEPSILTTKNNTEDVRQLLSKLATALNDAQVSTTVSQATIDSWSDDISGARTSVNTAITNHSVAREKLNTAETALHIAQTELALKEAGSTHEQIAAQDAAVAQAEANVSSQRAEIKLKESAVLAAEVKVAKNILRSPITGIVTKQSAKDGAIVGANEIIVSIISEGEFEIEAFIVEADITHLEVGDKAELTLDAYGDDVVFKASIVNIDPAAELVEGVANYKATLNFANGDERIRSGMTADIDIVTAERINVIAIPQRSVIFRDNVKVVRILENDELREVEVRTGITGGRGEIEILQGIKEGDVVVTTIRN